MPRLMLPGVEMRASFTEAMREFQAEGRGREHDRSMVGDEIRDGRGETACDEDNVALWKVIEANGGELEFRGDGIRRYWAAT